MDEETQSSMWEEDNSDALTGNMSESGDGDDPDDSCDSESGDDGK
jgi:hypothetical protein